MRPVSKLAQCVHVVLMHIGLPERRQRARMGRRAPDDDREMSVVRPAGRVGDPSVQIGDIIIFHGRSDRPGHRFFTPADAPDACFPRVARRSDFQAI